MSTKEYNESVKLYSDDLFRFALRYTGDSQESEDCVQDCFVTLWEHHKTIDAGTVKAWLIRILYRKLIDLHRHKEAERKVQQHMSENQQSHNTTHAQYELQDTLQQALNKLPDIQRQLVLLKDLEGYGYSEMAEMTGITEQQVGVYLFRARKTLRTIIGAPK